MKKISKKLVAVVLAIVMVLSAVPLSQLTGIDFTVKTKAANVTYTSGIYSYTVNDNGYATITDCDSSASGAIVIPSKLDGYPVTLISSYAFSYCQNMTSVVIPDGVISIGSDAFYYCTKLASISIPDSVTRIGDYAFYNCSSLTGVTIPDNVTEIGYRAFYGCSKLKSITIPENVMEIGSCAFASCNGITSFSVDSNNQYYTSDEFGVLYDKEKTNLIQYPAGSAETSYTIPDGVTMIGDYAFANCTKLTSVSMPYSITEIDDYAFYYCYNLTDVTIPDGVISVGYDAFYDCDGIVSITIPESVTYIGNSAFAYCSNLADIRILGDATSVHYSSFNYTAYYYDNANWDNGILYIDSYLLNGNKASGALIVKDGTKVVAGSAFSGAYNLTSIIIPESVTYIGNYAFESCDALTSVSFSGSNVTLGEYAFCYCDALTNVEFSGSNVTFGDYAFYYCDNLVSITIPDNSTFGDYVFYCCDNLATINAGKGIKGLDENDIKYTAFYNNESNWENGILYIGNCLVAVNSDVKGVVTIKDGVTEIADNLFSGKFGITEIVLPNSVETIGNSAFAGCMGLKKINLPEGIKSISSAAFALCFGISEITLPSTLETLDAATFLLCIGLETISIPANITKIPDLAFAGCVKLKNAPISNVNAIGIAAFLGCADFTSINIGASINEIGIAAFAGCTSVEKFIVDAMNSNYSSDSYGALFNKDKTMLLAYPSASTTTDYAIPETVKVMDFAFVSCKNLETLNIPANYGVEYDEFSLVSLFASTITMKIDFEALITKIVGLGESLLDYVTPLSDFLVALLGSSGGSYNRQEALQAIADIVNDVLDYINTIENADAAIGKITGLISDVLTSATLDNFKTYTVTKGNSRLYAKDGLLYLFEEHFDDNDDVSVLLSCPAGKTGIVKLDINTTDIAPVAFALCNVDEIVIPSKVNEILPGVFALCDVGKVEIPTTVETADALAFGLGKFGELEIANGSKIFETSSEYSPFTGCIAEKIILPDSLEEIASNYFMICLAKEYKLPKNLKSIGNQSFVGNILLEKLDIPDSVEIIGQSAFLGSIKLSDVNITENSKLKSIGEMAFTITNLSDFFVPAGTETIGTLALNPSVGGAIDSVYELMKPELEEMVAKIKEDYNVDFNMEKINSTVEHIASWFNKNAGVTVDARNPYFSSLNGDLYNYDKTNLIKVAETANGLYEIESDVMNIGAGAFSFTCVNEIVVPNNVTSIETGAFSLAPITEISLGTGIKEIPNATFSGCTLLERVTILPTVVSIADDAFDGCSDNITIVGYQDSYAYTYAVDHEIKFESIDGKGYVSFKAPSEVASSEVPVYGHAVPNTLVEIFDDGVKVGEIVSADNGYWRTTIELDNPVNNQVNVLVAKVNAGTDKEAVSKEVNVLYTLSTPTFESITCYHGSQNRTITMETLGIVPKHMSFSSSNSFTYAIKLSAYDGNKTLYVVSGGKKLPAVYDARTDTYFATGYFDENNHSYVPEYVTLELGGCTLANTSFRFPFIIDPSGFVYEAVHSNRVEGATASIYFQDENGLAQLWKDAPIFGQESTIITGVDGIFEWDVPNGLWQVMVEKEDYETAYSDWLPVPPEQLEVYIGVISKLAPTVKLVDGYTDGIDVTFNQYMEIDSVNDDNVVVTDNNGNEVYGYWSAVDAEVSGTDTNVYYATTFKFYPYYSDSLTCGDEYNIMINDVKNYAGKVIEAPYSEKITIRSRVTTLNIPESLNLVYGNEYAESDENKILIDGGVEAAGMTVSVTLSDNFYVESVSSVTLDENGKATIAVIPVTPGSAIITFNLDGTNLVEKSKVEVLLPEEVKVTGITLSDSVAEIQVGSEKQIYANVAPDFATNVAVRWTSSDESVATVDESGRVIGIKAGTATITATTVNGNFTATCDVKVTGTVGDVNGDGRVNTLDRVILTRYIAKWEEYPEGSINVAAADVNCDGKINTLDRVILTRYIAKWEGYETLPYNN